MLRPATPKPADAAWPTLEEATNSRADRLTRVAARQIAERGLADASARSVAAEAGVAVGTVNHNFGGIEQLFSSAFAFGAGLSQPWMEAREREFEALPRNAGAAAFAVEHVVQQWTKSNRSLALLYQECVAAPAETRLLGWTALWRDFWLRIAASLGLDDFGGRLLHLFFEFEALHNLSAWSPALEQAALRELGQHLGGFWLGAAASPPIGALAGAERIARSAPTQAYPATALRIMHAAAETVEECGLAGLTHRSVAARAELTTGAVTHYFRTINDLVAGAVYGQVQAIVRGSEVGSSFDMSDVRSFTELFAEFRRLDALIDQGRRPWFDRRKLFLATVRRPDLAEAGAVLRYSYGRNSYDILRRNYAVPPDLWSLHGGLLSRLNTSLRVACAADPCPAESREMLRSRLDAHVTEHLRLK